jgi:malonate decarboxylase delta subunit
MEKFEFRYPAGQPAARRAMVGVVGSGDLEVLLEPGPAGHTRIRVTTSVDGFVRVWQAQLDRLFKLNATTRPALEMEINDFGATPGVVGLRVAQALEMLDGTASRGRS